METKKIGEIREEFKAAEETMLPSFIEKYRSDERAGVQKLIEQANGRLAKLEAERARIDRLWKYEREYGMYTRICGIDEVGRGPLAGPVVAGAVILPKDCDILYINDSKKLSAAKREELYDVIMEKAVAVGIGMVGPERIDEINILQATYEAMREAISKLGDAPDILLNDAVTIPGVAIRQVPIIKGDAKSISIGAASIVAKVTRDRLMVEYDKIMPGYGFAANKGYGNAVTTSRDVTDRAYACQVLLSLCETVGMRLRRDGQAGSCVTIQLRTSEFETWSHQMRLASATNVTGELYQAACSLLDQAWDRKTPLRQLGVSVTQLADGTLRQYSLFDAADYARQEKLDTAVDALREKFGEGALFRAALLHSDERMAGGLHKKRRTGITKPIEDEAARIRKKYGNND